MNKQTKMWLGVGVVAAAAYYFWNKSKAEKKNANGPFDLTPSNTRAQRLGPQFLPNSANGSFRITNAR